MPCQAAVYFTLLPDGRLLWLGGAAPAGDAGLEALMDDIAESLARPSAPAASFRGSPASSRGELTCIPDDTPVSR